MAAYLVMKNNMKRVFQNKMTYLYLLLIPIVIALVGAISGAVSEKHIRVGVLEGEAWESIAEELNALEPVLYEKANPDTVNTDSICGRYHYVVDCNSVTARQVVTQIKEQCQKDSLGTTNQLSDRERVSAMIMVLYMVIATIYATKFIRDRRMGVVQRFCLSGNKKISYYIGYIGSTGMILCIHMVVLFTALRILNRQLVLEHLWQVVLVAAVITVFSTIYGAFHSFVYKKEMVANMMASSVAIIMSLLGGTFVSVDKMPMLLQKISYISPVRWLLAILACLS